jgi:hypothetical protein
MGQANEKMGRFGKVKAKKCVNYCFNSTINNFKSAKVMLSYIDSAKVKKSIGMKQKDIKLLISY